MSGGKVTVAKRRFVFARDGGRCVYCGIPVRLGIPADYVKGEPVADDIATVDHIIPNGISVVDNLATACGPCNEDKGNFLPRRHPLTGEPTEGVTWDNVWLRSYRRELLEHGVPLMSPRVLVNNLLS